MKQSQFQLRDGFHVRAGEFILPPDPRTLDPQSKRTVTICNLFVNHRYSISDVARVLDEERRKIIHVLIRQGLIRDRRVHQRQLPEEIDYPNGSPIMQHRTKLTTFR